MARLAELPAELVLHIVSFLTREVIIEDLLRGVSYSPLKKKDILPDFSSINALSRTNSVFHHALNHNLYQLCTSVESLGRLALLFAVKHNSEAAFNKLVAVGVSVDGEFECKFWFTGIDLFSLLHIAAGMGSSLIVPKLLGMYGSETPERVYACDAHDLSALDYAVLEGHMEIVKLLAPKAVVFSSLTSAGLPISDDRLQVHKQYLSRALLHSATRATNIAICEYLLSEGADVNFQGTTHLRSSPLGGAAQNDNLPTMQLLLGAGADPNLRNRDGFVPLFKAVSVSAAQALLDAGAHIHATDNAGRNAVTHRVVEGGEALRFLLERGVDPNHVDEEGWTPLHYACWVPSVSSVATIELLFQFGATTVEKAVNDGRTPVDLAIRTGKTDVVRLLEPLIQDPVRKARIAEWLEGRA
ncbi:MHC-I C-terminus family protein [Mycena sanguinolenta]|uniref:MHC-I C-terminus family protein n=1 Tax=Mycena sanguinolenta TaxID=230812 RepID=A0A8H7D9M7_9AGAR|nr:MHC-I C-terminus family protein [Mycena sanguinolenta]